MNPEPIHVDFRAPAPAKKSVRYQHLGNGDYVDSRTGHHYENPKVNGRYTWRKLNATTHAAAVKEIRKKRSDQELAKLGLATDPYKRAVGTTVADLAEFYLRKNCPRKNKSVVREGPELEAEKKRIATLISWPGLRKPIAEFTLADCPKYHAWRIAQMAAKKLHRAGGDPSMITDARTGDRQVDKELVTLSNAFRCAMRHADETGITRNPIGEERPSFRDSSKVKHCRDCQPKNGDEFHLIARTLLASWRSAVLGWQTLFEGMIGHRTSEMIRLRMDAGPEQPGFVKWNGARNGGILFLLRKESHKGTYGHIRIHPALSECLKAHAAWHARHWPRSPWYFPSPEDPSKPVSPGALTHALRRTAQELGLPHRTSHGLRSYSVNVQRSQRRSDGTPKLTDAEVALRHGQKTGGKLIIEVYGEINADPLSYLPSGANPPAWDDRIQLQFDDLLIAASGAEQLTLDL